MSQWSMTRIAVAFTLLGAALMAVVLGAAWAGYQLLAGGKQVAIAVGSEAAPPPAAPGQPGAAAEAGKKTAVPEVPLSPTQVKPAKSEGTESAAQPGVEPDKAQDPKVAAARDDEAREKAHQEELAYAEKKFDERKAQWMAVIDTYLSLPAEERQEYLRKAMEELRLAIEAERQAEGLPPRPADQRRVFREMMGMMRDRLSEDEKKKVGTFVTDVMQSQVARMQAEIERHLTAPPSEAPAPSP